MVAAKDKAYLGGVKVTVDVPDFTFRTRQQLRDFRNELYAAHNKGLDEGVKIMRRILGAKKYFDTGTLQNSVVKHLFRRTTDSFGGEVTFEKPGKDYAYFVEYGRSPGKPPPLKRMVEWGDRHGLTFGQVMGLRHRIAVFGVKGRPFMGKATEQIQAKYARVIASALDKFNKRNR